MLRRVETRAFPVSYSARVTSAPGAAAHQAICLDQLPTTGHIRHCELELTVRTGLDRAWSGHRRKVESDTRNIYSSRFGALPTENARAPV